VKKNIKCTVSVMYLKMVDKWQFDRNIGGFAFLCLGQSNLAIKIGKPVPEKIAEVRFISTSYLVLAFQREVT